MVSPGGLCVGCFEKGIFHNLLLRMMSFRELGVSSIICWFEIVEKDIYIRIACILLSVVKSGESWGAERQSESPLSPWPPIEPQ